MKQFVDICKILEREREREYWLKFSILTLKVFFHHKNDNENVFYPSNFFINEIKFKKKNVFDGVHAFYEVIAILSTVDIME